MLVIHGDSDGIVPFEGTRAPWLGYAIQPTARWRRTVLQKEGGPLLGARHGTSVGSPIFAR